MTKIFAMKCLKMCFIVTWIVKTGLKIHEINSLCIFSALLFLLFCIHVVGGKRTMKKMSRHCAGLLLIGATSRGLISLKHTTILL